MVSGVFLWFEPYLRSHNYLSFNIARFRMLFWQSRNVICRLPYNTVADMSTQPYILYYIIFCTGHLVAFTIFYSIWQSQLVFFMCILSHSRFGRICVFILFFSLKTHTTNPFITCRGIILHSVLIFLFHDYDVKNMNNDDTLS